MLLRLITRLVLLLVLGVLASGVGVARIQDRVWPPAASAEKLAPGVFESEAAILRQAAAMQAAELQQAKSGRGYDFASGCCLAPENAASFRPWEIGDSITKALPDGSYPKWFSSAAADKAATVQGRYWMNRAAASAPGEFTTRQLAQMRSGFAPQAKVVVRKMANGVPGPESVQTISKELHHNLRNRGVPGFDEPLHLREVWPWQHELIDQFRHTGYEFVRFAD